MLAARANHGVSVSELIDALWESPPASAENVVHGYVSGLRRVLEPSRAPRAAGRFLARIDRGYLLRLEPGGLDAEVFGQRLAEARRLRATGEPADAERSYGQALRLWHGTAFSGVTGPFADTQRVRLEETRLAAAEEHADVSLQLGRHGQLTSELAALVREHPLRERLRGLLILALYRAGRQADALAQFRHVRRLLADELGVEPGAELQRLHQQILNGDPALAPPALAPPALVVSDGAGAMADERGPAQLPHDVPGFTGRQRELAELHALVAEAGDPGGTVVISAIDGTAGVGKTALAIRFARWVADSFPGGQLWVNLRGFGPGPGPLAPGDALGHLLRSLGMDPRQIPAGTDERAARYRELLAGRRALIVLDNAASAEQVRPLLPGQGGSVVLVTSRSRLTGLVTEDGAARIELGLLAPPEATALLAVTAGAARVAAEPQAASGLSRLCGYLPLALRIAAQQIAGRPHLRLADLAGELATERHRLDALTDDGHVPAVRAAFSWSYHALPAGQARTFRLLGLHPGPDISLAAAAALIDASPARARPLLDGLTGAHLLRETLPGRYQLHDLLRIYAAERAVDEELEADRKTAVRRLLTWYLNTAHAAAVIVRPGRSTLHLGPPEGAWQPPGFAGLTDALAWYELEHANLTAGIRLAAEQSEDAFAWKLAFCMQAFFDLRPYWKEWAAIAETGLSAARRLGDLEAEASLLGALGVVYSSQNRDEQALECHQQALAIASETGNRRGVVVNLNDIGAIHFYGQRYQEAASYFQRAVAAGRKACYPRLEGMALANLGETYRELGRLGPAIDQLRQAQAIFRELGDQFGVGETAHQLGETFRHFGQAGAALEHFREALDVRVEVGNLHGQAQTLTSLAEALRGEGRDGEAHDALRRALAILENLHDPQAAQIRDHLRSLTSRQGRPPPPVRTFPEVLR